jgi:DNA polymerase III alpha subunit
MMTLSAEKQKQLEGLVKHDRVAMPDIDIADGKVDKGEVIDYIKNKYPDSNEL